jgi:hypothetical protein
MSAMSGSWSATVTATGISTATPYSGARSAPSARVGPSAPHQRVVGPTFVPRFRGMLAGPGSNVQPGAVRQVTTPDLHDTGSRCGDQKGKVTTFEGIIESETWFGLLFTNIRLTCMNSLGEFHVRYLLLQGTRSPSENSAYLRVSLVRGWPLSAFSPPDQKSQGRRGRCGP